MFNPNAMKESYKSISDQQTMAPMVRNAGLSLLNSESDGILLCCNLHCVVIEFNVKIYRIIFHAHVRNNDC